MWGVTEDIVIVSWVAGVSLLTLAPGDTSFLNICLLGFIFTKYMTHTVMPIKTTSFPPLFSRMLEENFESLV